MSALFFGGENDVHRPHRPSTTMRPARLKEPSAPALHTIRTFAGPGLSPHIVHRRSSIGHYYKSLPSPEDTPIERLSSWHPRLPHLAGASVIIPTSHRHTLPTLPIAIRFTTPQGGLGLWSVNTAPAPHAHHDVILNCTVGLGLMLISLFLYTTSIVVIDKPELCTLLRK